MNDLRCTLDGIGRPRILVLGDAILDSYTWGEVERISPEAPVPVLRATQREIRPGGAASVAALLRGLDADVVLAGVVGPDHEGRRLRLILTDLGVETKLLLVDEDRETTTKERFLGRAASGHPHQMLRVDHESCQTLSEDLERQLIDAVCSRLNGFHAVLVADYGKGCCTPRLLESIIAQARQEGNALPTKGVRPQTTAGQPEHPAQREGVRPRLWAKPEGIPVLVDPARGSDFSKYRGATLLKPNRLEASLASGRSIVTLDDARAAANWLKDAYAIQTVVVTLDQDGMVFATQDGQSQVVTTRSRSVYDITGAGDMVLAALGIAIAAQRTISEAAELANHAAALEIEHLGIVTITREQIRKSVEASLAEKSTSSGAMSLDDLMEQIKIRRSNGERIVFTNGCFDLFHAGHLRCLEEARSLGDVLVVAMNSDASVRQLKGPERPIVSERERAALIGGLSCVDYVVIFDESTPNRLLEMLRPDVLVKGGSTGDVIGREIVESYGGRVVVTGLLDGWSTTNLVARIQQQVVETA